LESELTKVVAEEAQKRYDFAAKELDRRREETASAITAAETATLQEIQDLQTQGLMNQAWVDANKSEVTKNRLKLELQAEKDHIRALEALPAPNSPEKEREHQKQIREARLKTAQLTLQISEQEFQVQQKLRDFALKAIEEQGKAASNIASEIGNISQAVDVAATIASNALERQNKLLESRKSLQSAISNLVQAEYKILIDSEADEKHKAKLQEQAAVARVNALKESQAIERSILELQLEQEKVQSRVAIAKAGANLLKSEAEIAKALRGDWREEHLFTLRQSLEAWRFHQNLMADCDQQIAYRMDASRIRTRQRSPASLVRLKIPAGEGLPGAVFDDDPAANILGAISEGCGELGRGEGVAIP
jgi:hypothetical protein